MGRLAGKARNRDRRLERHRPRDREPFRRRGRGVAACGRDPERVQRTVDEIGVAGGTAVGLLGDVATVEGAQAVADGAAEQLGGIDVLVNNAGIDASEWHDLHEWPVEEFDRILATNLRGPFLVSKFALPHLLAAGGGSIVHISSVCAITVWAGIAPTTSPRPASTCSPTTSPSSTGRAESVRTRSCPG